MLAGLALGVTSGWSQTAPTYSITSASPASIPAGAAGASIGLNGTLPDFTNNTYQVCFFAGAGSSAPLTPTAVGGVQTISVPASIIQNIAPSSFTAANGYAVSALLSVAPAGQTCDGTFDATLTNSLSIPVVEPTLGTYIGPTSLPQANSAAGVQGAPIAITLSGANFVANTTVAFGSFGRVTPRTITPTALTLLVPAMFSSSDPNTTASLSVCNGSDATTYFCSTPATPITLTVNALAASSGTITATPSPVLTSGQTRLTSTFKQSGYSTNPVGSPSGTVTFVADGTTLPKTRLILDKTAGFTPVTSSLTVPAAATPVITPAAGTYLNSATITLTDTTAGASIYYTTDGSMPTTGSTLYTGPFSITTSETITAIAALSGSFNSASSSATYTIRISPPTQLAFSTQPGTTAINTSIAPAVQVAVEDANGNVVTSFTGAVSVALITNPGSSTLSGTLSVNAVGGIATFSDLAINNVANGYVIQAISGRLTPAVSNAFNITPYPITLTLQSELVGIMSTLNGTFTLGHPAPTGGLTVTLASSVPANVTIAPATVTVAAGQTMGSFTYSGVAAGDSNLTASAPNYQTGTTKATGTAAQVSLYLVPPVAPGQSVSLALSLATAAPPGGTMVTFTSSRPSIATVTSTISVPAGQFTASANPQVTGVLIGTTTITANAPGYAPANLVVNVTVTATISPSTTTINLATSTGTTLAISAPAPTGGLTFTLSSDDPTTATVPASVTLVKGATSVPLPVTGVKAGSTTIRADSPGVTEATGAVNVVSQIGNSSVATGYHLENSFYQYLPLNPQSPLTVTVTSNDPSVVTLSLAATTVGTKTVTFPNTTSSYVGYVYFQGQKIGTTTLTVSAPGFQDGTIAVTVDPAGVTYYYYQQTLATTTFAQASNVTAYLTILNPDLSVLAQGYQLNPGLAPVSTPVTSSNTAIGTVTGSPLTFHANESQETYQFNPVAVGTTNLTIGAQPAGFATSTQNQTVTATVTSPVISVGAITTGNHLINGESQYLPVAPPSGETVTITSSNPAVFTISANTSTVGATSITYPGTTGTYVGPIYVQGQSVGTATLTVSAPGYVSGTATVTVQPSGFAFYGDRSGTTTTFSGTTTNAVYSTILNSDLSFAYPGYALNPGYGPVSVGVSSATTSVGTISPGTLVFHAGDSQQTVTFTPVSAGSTVVSIGAAPTGFSKPTQYQSYTATVTAPAISIGNLLTGVHLTNSMSISLPQVPPSATTVTVSVPANAAGTVLLSTSATAVGTTSLTFANITGSYVGQIFFQGQGVGSTTLTVAAPGYVSGTSTVTVNPSGFAFAGNQSYTTSTFSGSTQRTLYASILDSSLAPLYYGFALNPGVGPVSVALTDSAPSVATVTPAALVFNTGDSSQQITVQPVSAGAAVVSIAATPAGFSTPTMYQQYTATVTAPAISISNVVAGLHLETAMDIYLPVAPPNAVTVMVLSNGLAIAGVSSSATDVGTNAVLFPNTTGTYVGRIYVQGEKIGTTTLTVMAAGYTDGNSTITVLPSGFSYDGSPNISTTSSSSTTARTVYACQLNTGTLTLYSCGYGINPDFAPVNVSVTSSDPTVGTVTSPVAFAASSGTGTFEFQPVATGTSTLTLGTPDGFSTPSQYTTITATVQ
ncbi:beta strand repeat-containing protein [Granulicella sibirica]|uniref:GH29D-like beta-sandwich domain-containing protein n=1 Tax=Granulicella sibirica TaxID=2479048 RepID=A0A4Q0SXJ2_9BACT|nr:chitobiase/beta-hexosaminidase C-terminal domain-containing protein [Granulicella sibirica]RXH55863.1 hypothetical protein GRAN_2720 [Granulicella sibirica]